MDNERTWSANFIENKDNKLNLDKDTRMKQFRLWCIL